MLWVQPWIKEHGELDRKRAKAGRQSELCRKWCHMCFTYPLTLHMCIYIYNNRGAITLPKFLWQLIVISSSFYWLYLNTALDDPHCGLLIAEAYSNPMRAVLIRGLEKHCGRLLYMEFPFLLLPTLATSIVYLVLYVVGTTMDNWTQGLLKPTPTSWELFWYRA